MHELSLDPSSEVDAAHLLVGDRFLPLRRARRADVADIVALLVDDPIGATREGGHDRDLQSYLDAFERIDASPADLLVVVENEQRELIATRQLTLLHGLSRAGASRMQVEAVRVRADERSTGVGSSLLTWVEQHSRALGVSVLQLSTDKRRVDAHRFYERLGWVASHEGMKLHL